MARRSSKPAAPRGDALDSAYRLLGRRAHSRAELQRKLQRRGYERSAIDSAVRVLADRGYLDDAAFARSYIRRRSARRGPMALSGELAARGIDRGLVQEALAELDPEAELQAAIRIGERLYAAKPVQGHRQMLDSVGAKLLRLGFSVVAARAACISVLAEASKFNDS